MVQSWGKKTWSESDILKEFPSTKCINVYYCGIADAKMKHIKLSQNIVKPRERFSRSNNYETASSNISMLPDDIFPPPTR